MGLDLELVPQQLGIWIGAREMITVHRGHSVSIDAIWERTAKQGKLAEPGRLALRVIHFASGRYLGTLLEFEERLGELEDGLLGDISELVAPPVNSTIGYGVRGPLIPVSRESTPQIQKALIPA